MRFAFDSWCAQVRSSNRLLRHAIEQMTTAVRMRKLEASRGAAGGGGGGSTHRQSLAERLAFVSLMECALLPFDQICVCG